MLGCVYKFLWNNRYCITYTCTHKQIIRYEGANLLCTKCERLGHVARRCQFAIPNSIDKQDETNEFLPTLNNTAPRRKSMDGIWCTFLNEKIEYPH